MATYEYTLTTDAFSVGQYSFPAESITFTRLAGQSEVLLSGEFVRAEFGNSYPFGLQSVTLFTGPAYPLDFFANTPGELYSLHGYGFLVPTISAPDAISSALNFSATIKSPAGLNGCPNCPSYQTAIVGGTLTETALNLPEPSMAALTGIAAALLLARYIRLWGIRGRSF